MIKVEQSLVIDRPVDEVFAFVANVEDNAQWQSGVLEVRKTSQGAPWAWGRRALKCAR